MRNVEQHIPFGRIKGVLSGAECTTMRQHQSGWSAVRLARGNGEIVTRPDHCSARAALVYEDRPLVAELRQRILRLIPEINKHYQFQLHAESEFDLLAPIIALEYRASHKGHFNWHTDTGMHEQVSQRKISIVIPISHPTWYRGGELLIEDSETHATGVTSGTGQGDLLFFPSYTAHAVTPVTEGVRHSLVTFIQGPRFR